MLTRPIIFCSDGLKFTPTELCNPPSTNASNMWMTSDTVFAEMQPFKGVKNYFTDSLIYQREWYNSEETIVRRY